MDSAIDERVGSPRSRKQGSPPPAHRRRPSVTAPSALHAIRLGPRYWRLWGASSASALGDGLALVAFPLLAATLTGDARLVAGVAVASRLPWLLFGLPAGALADRVDRRLLLGAVELSRMAVLIILGVTVATGSVSLAAIYAAAFALGALETAFSAASQACLPALVVIDQLPRANGYLFAAQATGEQFAGPALGGLLFAAAAALPFVLDGVSFLASAALLCLALPRRRGRTSPPQPAAAFRQDVLSGLRWFANHPILRLLALVVASLAFCQSMVLAILVLYCLRVLHLSHAGFGLFLALAAVGNVVGGLLAGRITARLGTGRVVFSAALLAAASYLVVGLTSAVGVAVLALAAEAVAVAVGNVATLSLRQSVIPGELLGRVGNAFRMCIFGVIPLGALTGGLIAHSVGLHAPFLVAGGLQLLVISLVGPRLAQRMARLKPPSDEVIDLDRLAEEADLLLMESGLLSTSGSFTARP